MKKVPYVDHDLIMRRDDRVQLLHRAINALEHEILDETLYKKKKLEIQRSQIQRKGAKSSHF